jgi:hypothetical protein
MPRLSEMEPALRRRLMIEAQDPPGGLTPGEYLAILDNPPRPNYQDCYLSAIRTLARLDKLTISGCAGAIFVAFQQRSGQWLPATVIDTLVDLAHQDWERPESRGPPACHRGVGLTSAYGRPDRRQKGRPGCTSIPLRTVRDRKDETRLHDEQPMPYDADARRVGEAPSSCWHSGQTVPVPPAEADDARDAATRAALEVLRERARYWAERAVGASRNCPK